MIGVYGDFIVDPSVFYQEFKDCDAAKKVLPDFMARLRTAAKRYEEAKAKGQVRKQGRPPKEPVAGAEKDTKTPQ